MQNKDKPQDQSIWDKVKEASHAFLDNQISKASIDATKKPADNEDFLYAKSITDEPS